jgi:hypothetical protein
MSRIAPPLPRTPGSLIDTPVPVPAARVDVDFPKVRAWALAAALLLPACGGDHHGSSGADPQPDFSLMDVNPNSATTGTMVSPRDYLGSTAGVYFGHAT